MRFGLTLKLSIYSPWRDQYIDYPKLKKLLRDEESAPNSPAAEPKEDPWTEQDEGAFVNELVNVQLEKVHAFHKETYERLRDRTAKCEANLDNVAVAEIGKAEAQKEDENHASVDDAGGRNQGLFRGATTSNDDGSRSGNGKQPFPSEQEQKNILKQTLEELDQITKEIGELEKYCRINYTGFLKAVKKHDRKRGASYRIRPLLQVRLAALPFNKEDYSPLLYRLSAMYSFIRQHLDGVESRGLSMAESQPGQDEYISQKFWVHPENLLEVKTMILRRLPVLVYNPQSSKIAQGSQPDPSITSIYFDNPSFSLYTNKVEHNHGSSLRLRWYGQLTAKPLINVEKKTIDEHDTSHETRFTTKEKYIQSFVTGTSDMSKQINKLSVRFGPDHAETTKFRTAATETQAFIKEHSLQPVARANYTRTAFQIPGDDRVRISLDTDLAFIREDAIDLERPCRDPEAWHRTDIDDNELSYPFTSIRKGEVSRFPFALLEVKTRPKVKSEWIEDLINSHLVKEAPRFSKFVHGVSVLFEDYVNTFPFWLSDMEADIRRDPQQAFEEEQEKRRKEREDEFAVGSLIKGTSSPRDSGSRQEEKNVVSPFTSPNMEGKTKPLLQIDGTGLHSYAWSSLSQTAVPEPNQQAETAGEPDDDETGQHTHDTTRDHNTTTTSGLKTLFSTSKYAQSRRRGRKLPPGVSEPAYWIKDAGPVKVEAKVWLANQRTFVKWQHVSVLLASLSLGLYNAAGVDNSVARGLAVVYTLVAVFAGVWGYGVFMWRNSLISKRSGKDFDAVGGPVVVCLGLVVALCLNFGFKVSWLWVFSFSV